ncbi:MAG TPA: right-handed parallel beta-helix repeat-containing protein [Candidatus Binatia bacterium]
MRAISGVVLGLLLASASVAHAADYWVRNGGNDANDGLSIATAWATLVHAATRVAPGDTVHVLDGDYQGFYLTRSGAPGAPITFRAEGPNVRITANNPITPDGINLEGASHVVIDGFVVNERTRAGIRAVLGSHVTVRNCKLGWNGRWGILTGFVDDFVAEHNEAHHSQIEHGIYVSNSSDRPIVRNNLIWSNNANGIHFNGDASLGGDGLIEDALVEGNVIWDNGRGGGSGINMDGGTRSTIRNNLLFDNHASGISLYRIDASAGAKDNLVINNTIIQASDARWAININNGSTGNTLHNNILYSFHSFRGVISIDASSRPGFSSDYNSVMSRFSADGGDTIVSLAAWQALGYDVHSFVATPAQHFVAPGSDFHLLPTSPAVDAGTASGAPTVDLDGAPRPVGAGVDVGAYELQLAQCGDGDLDPGEECESDDDCAAGATCAGCTCSEPPTPAVCESGPLATKPVLVLRGSPFSLTFAGQAIVPKPWSGVNPSINGVRVVVADADGVRYDVTVPGGERWTVNAAGTRWLYRDPKGTVDGIVRVVVHDRSRKADGLLDWRVVAKHREAVEMPDPASATAAIVLGAEDECARAAWNPPGGARPRCQLQRVRVACR